MNKTQKKFKKTLKRRKHVAAIKAANTISKIKKSRLNTKMKREDKFQHKEQAVKNSAREDTRKELKSTGWIELPTAPYSFVRRLSNGEIEAKQI